MVRTKCQPKIGTDKMPTTIKSPDKMPTFGWHYVRLAFCPHTSQCMHLLHVHLSFESSPLTHMTKLTILSPYNLKMSFFSLILTSNCYFAHNKTLLKYISQMLELLYMTHQKHFFPPFFSKVFLLLRLTVTPLTRQRIFCQQSFLHNI